MLIYKNFPDLVLTCVGANTQGVRCRIIAVLNFAMFTRTTLISILFCFMVFSLTLPFHECMSLLCSIHVFGFCTSCIIYNITNANAKPFKSQDANRPFPSVAEFWFGVADDIVFGPLRRLVSTENHLQLSWTKQKQFLHREHLVKPGYNTPTYNIPYMVTVTGMQL